MRRILPIRSLAVLALISAAGCAEDKGERIPLGGDTNAAAATRTLSSEARATLDEGNRLFRAKQYAEALAAYRRAAVQAPADVAPLWGIQMAARALNDAALADSAIQRIRAIAPDAAPGAGADPHAPGAAGAAPPLPAGGANAPLPPNHPPVNAQGGRVSGSPR